MRLPLIRHNSEIQLTSSTPSFPDNMQIKTTVSTIAGFHVSSHSLQYQHILKYLSKQLSLHTVHHFSEPTRFLYVIYSEVMQLHSYIIYLEILSWRNSQLLTFLSRIHAYRSITCINLWRVWSPLQSTKCHCDEATGVLDCKDICLSCLPYTVHSSWVSVHQNAYIIALDSWILSKVDILGTVQVKRAHLTRMIDIL